MRTDISRIIFSSRPRGAVIPERIHDQTPEDEPGDGHPDDIREADEKCELGHGDISDEGEPNDTTLEFTLRGEMYAIQAFLASMKFRGR